MIKIPIKELIKAEKFLNRYGISLLLYAHEANEIEECAEEYIDSVRYSKELSESEYKDFRKHVIKTCANRVSIENINVLMKVLLKGNYPNKLLADYCSNNLSDDYLRNWFMSHPRYDHENSKLGSIILSYIDNFFCVSEYEIFNADGRLNPLLFNDGDLDDDNDKENNETESESSVAVESDKENNVYDSSDVMDDEFPKRIISSVIDKTNSHFMVGKSEWEKICYPIYFTLNSKRMRNINVVILFGKLGKDFIRMNEYIEETSFTNATAVYAIRTSILNLDDILSEDKYNLVIVDSNVKSEYIHHIDNLSRLFDTTLIRIV